MFPSRRCRRRDLIAGAFVMSPFARPCRAASVVPSFGFCRGGAALRPSPPRLLLSRSRSRTEQLGTFGKYSPSHGGPSPFVLRSSLDEDDEKEDEIFFDDFSGQAIGDRVSSLFLPEDELEPASATAQEDELPDFDDDATDDNQRGSDELIAISLPRSRNSDLTGSSLRQFSLGPDVLLSDYAGSQGYDKVTDWEYYATDEDTGERTPVSPRPMDPTQPRRTTSSSGGVVRLFRGELGGRLAGKLRSRGLDARVLVKEYFGEEAINLARAEQRGLGRIQSAWLKQYLEKKNKNDILERIEEGKWAKEAQRRYVDGLTDTPSNKDDENIITLLELLLSQKAQFPALLGELDLSDYYDDETLEPNEWYKMLGVKPPQPGSVWLVFDYHGLSTAASYAVPALVQRSKLPPKRGVFGGVVAPPALPPFGERARYLVQGVLRGMLGAVAAAHSAGIVHRSVGRGSFLLGSTGQDKRVATSPYATVTARLRMVLSDWGFSATVEEAAQDKELGVRSRLFDIPAVGSYEDLRTADGRIEAVARRFAMAEDLNALGFTFLAMLFTTLAEPATVSAPMPPTDDDSWQRLFSEIFEKDMEQFREYCSNEEVWDSVVALLDREDRAGWNLLGDLLLARERLSEWYNNKNSTEEEMDDLVSANGLLSHPFFR